MERIQQRDEAPDIRKAEGFGAAVKQIERLLFAASYSILRNATPARTRCKVRS